MTVFTQQQGGTGFNSLATLASAGNPVGDAIAGKAPINFLQTGTGAVARPVLSKLADAPVFPADFGTVGTSNDTAVINAALATGGAQTNIPHTITGTVLIDGYTSAAPKKNQTLILGPNSNGLVLSGSGALNNKGFMIGLGACYNGGVNVNQSLLKLHNSNFVELYASAVSAHATGNFNGILGVSYMDGNSGNGMPFASGAYGMNVAAGSSVFGFFGRVDSRAAGVVTHELDTFNFFGETQDFSGGFPSRGFGISNANPVCLTIACGGLYRSTAGIQITREGTPSNGGGANFRCGMYIDGRYVTDYGIFMDSDGQNGGTTYNNGQGAPSTLFLARMAPTSINGFAIQCVGNVSLWTSVRTMLSLANNTVNNDNSNSTQYGNCLTVTSDGNVAGRNWNIAPNGNTSTFGTFNASGNISSGATITGSVGSFGSLSVTNDAGIGGSITSGVTSVQYSPAGITIRESAHSSGSKRSAITIGKWTILQDTNGNGTKDFSFYDGANAKIPFTVAADSSVVSVAALSTGGNIYSAGSIQAAGQVIGPGGSPTSLYDGNGGGGINWNAFTTSTPSSGSNNVAPPANCHVFIPVYVNGSRHYLAAYAG